MKTRKYVLNYRKTYKNQPLKDVSKMSKGFKVFSDAPVLHPKPLSGSQIIAKVMEMQPRGDFAQDAYQRDLNMMEQTDMFFS